MNEYTCPTTAEAGVTNGLLGCGAVFKAEPDEEGLVDCPECGIWFPDAETAPTVAPDDPLVIRFCNQGALIVAAWGDEAAFLNKAVQELKL